MTAIALLAAVLAAESLVRGRISTWPLTGPMIFVGAGLALGPDGLGVLEVSLENESVSLAAELTLALLLFSDASRINTMALRKLDLSITYAIWSGVGTAITATIGIVLFKESLTPLKVMSILLIITGVVGLHASFVDSSEV